MSADHFNDGDIHGKDLRMKHCDIHKGYWRFEEMLWGCGEN